MLHRKHQTKVVIQKIETYQINTDELHDLSCKASVMLVLIETGVTICNQCGVLLFKKFNYVFMIHVTLSLLEF